MLTGPLLYYVVVGTIVSASPMKSRGLIYGDWEWGWLHIAFSCLVSLVAITTGIIMRDSVTQSNAEVNSVDRV